MKCAIYIGALILRIGFWGYTITIIRNPKIVLVIIKAPTVAEA